MLYLINAFQSFSIGKTKSYYFCTHCTALHYAHYSTHYTTLCALQYTLHYTMCTTVHTTLHSAHYTTLCALHYTIHYTTLCTLHYTLNRTRASNTFTGLFQFKIYKRKWTHFFVSSFSWGREGVEGSHVRELYGSCTEAEKKTYKSQHINNTNIKYKRVSKGKTINLYLCEIL